MEETVALRRRRPSPGARQIAARAVHFAQPDATLEPVLANGRTGVLVSHVEERISLMVFTIDLGLITRIDALVDPHRLARLDVHLEGSWSGSGSVDPKPD